MEIFTTSLLLLVAGSTISILTYLLLKEKSRTSELLKAQAEANEAVQLQQLAIIEQNFAQLRAADPWQYQTIMSMGGAPRYDVEYDPSDEAEAKRIAERSNKQEELEETLNAQEAAVLDDIFPGFNLG